LTDVQAKGVSFLKEINPSVDLTEFEEMDKMNGFNALLTISSLDLIAIVKQIFSTTHTWETLYFVRQGYLTIYETLKTYDAYNSTLNEWVSKKYLNHKSIFHSICKEIKKFKNDYGYDKEMNNIRNFVSGHIHVNFVLFYDTVKSIDETKATEAINTFVGILTKLQTLSATLASEANSILQQNFASSEALITELKSKIQTLLNLRPDNNYS
jgi:hypothetical protein